MTRDELNALIEGLVDAGLKPVVIGYDDWPVDEELTDPEDVLGEYEGDEETNREIPISKLQFNHACDTVIYNWPGDEELDFMDIIKLAQFTSAVRYILFDQDKKTEKEEN